MKRKKEFEKAKEIDPGYANYPVMLTRKTPGYFLYSIVAMGIPVFFASTFLFVLSIGIVVYVFIVSRRYVKENIPFAVEKYKIANFFRDSRYAPNGYDKEKRR